MSKSGRPQTRLGEVRAQLVETERQLAELLRELAKDDEREDLPMMANPNTAPDRKLH
jgi:hypothetical protein